MSGHVWINRIGLISVLGWPWVATASDGAWYYRLNQAREKQQANFCDSKQSIEEIAAIFARFGPRTGYAALSESAHCKVAVHSFTPRKVLTSVTISKGEPGEYTLQFLEIEVDHGEVMYLVTTRDVIAE